MRHRLRSVRHGEVPPRCRGPRTLRPVSPSQPTERHRRSWVERLRARVRGQRWLQCPSPAPFAWLEHVERCRSHAFGQQSGRVVHVQNETHLNGVALAFAVHRLCGKTFTLNSFHLDVGGFHQNAQHVRSTVVDRGEQSLGISAFRMALATLLTSARALGASARKFGASSMRWNRSKSVSTRMASTFNSSAKRSWKALRSGPATIQP